MKSVFARYRIPDIVVSDNGPQFFSFIFQKFSEDYQFSHITSSPMYPQGNSQVEKGVQTIKILLKKAVESKEDPYLVLLSYRSTSLQNGYSPHNY